MRKVKWGRFIHTGESQQMFSPVCDNATFCLCVTNGFKEHVREEGKRR